MSYFFYFLKYNNLIHVIFLRWGRLTREKSSLPSVLTPAGSGHGGRQSSPSSIPCIPMRHPPSWRTMSHPPAIAGISQPSAVVQHLPSFHLFQWLGSVNAHSVQRELGRSIWTQAPKSIWTRNAGPNPFRWGGKKTMQSLICCCLTARSCPAN